MRSVVFLVTVLSGPALSADFRTLDIGSLCEPVPVQESALGARQIKWRAEGLGILAFEATAFDRRLVVTYFCPEGLLFAGNYFFPIETLTEATASYQSVHKQLSVTYGAPWLDNSPWMQPVVEPAILERDPRNYMTTWNTSRVRVTTTIMPSQADEPKGWRIFLVVRGNVVPERSNKSLERTRGG